MSFRYVIADDAPFIREIIKQTFEKVGAVCLGEATDGEECLHLVNKYDPDYLFLDIVMPKINGLVCAKKINEEHPEVQIIACSTFDPNEIAEKIKDLKIKKYLTKPFTKNDLLNTINT